MRTELPPIPVGDRFKDVLAFRELGTGGGAKLYECWEDAIKAYGHACYDKGHDAGHTAGYDLREREGQC